MLSHPLAIGAIGACTVLFPRVLIAASVLNLAVARALLPYLVAPLVIGVMTLVVWWRRSGHVDRPAEPTTNPLQIGPALQMAAVFQIVLFAVRAVRQFFGAGGLLVSGAVLGLTDVDALTISMAKVAEADGVTTIAARAIAVGIVANCVLKIGLAIGLGTPQFRRLTAMLLTAMAIAIVLSIAALR
jgi:uncharacterized membrane protein (DUF4010 family)